MKILINRKPIKGSWGGGNNFVHAFVNCMSESGHHVVHELQPEIDLIFIQDPRYDECGISINEAASYKNSNPSCKIIQRINECDARKGTEHMDSLLQQCSSINDYTIFVSRWMRDYFLEKGWACPKTCVIRNGVNLGIFSPNPINNHTRISIVAHHWSNNYLKGFDCYEFLDYMSLKYDHVNFTYIGRHRDSFENTNVVKPCWGKDLAKNLGGHTVYISGTRNDPGPNHILEAIACGLPTYVHIEGGGAVEFAGTDHVFRNLIDLEGLILGGKFEKNTTDVNGWEHCLSQYQELFARIT